MFVKKGDTVIIRKGKDAGKNGKVLVCFPKEGKVILENLNLKSRNQKPRKSGQKGQIVQVPSPINISNISLIDPKTKKATRVGYKMVGDKKVRISAKSKQEI